jgi:hypothetical protein
LQAASTAGDERPQKKRVKDGEYLFRIDKLGINAKLMFGLLSRRKAKAELSFGVLANRRWGGCGFTGQNSYLA